MDRLPTSQPHIGDAECRAMERVLRSGYYGMGPEVESFEAEITRYLDTRFGVACVSTGTSALQLAVAALRLDPGAEVLIPSLTFVASFQAVAAAGARPVACDVDPLCGLLDLADAEGRVTRHTRAVMAVHYAGNVGDLAALHAFARRHRLRVIEDAAHAFGSVSQGLRVGGAGDVICFSFDPIKNITSGQGGAVVSGDEAFMRRVRCLRDLGIERSTESAGSADFDVTECGWRYQMSDLMAAIGRVQLARFEGELKPARLRLAQDYERQLRTVTGVTLLPRERGAVPHILPIRLPASQRDAARLRLEAAGFECKIHYKPNHLLSAFADGSARPQCERLYRELLTLPTHAGVTTEHVTSIARILSECGADGQPRRA